MSASYPVRTLVEMTRIPDEALPRFLQEFPIMVRTMRAHIELMEGLHSAAGMDAPTDAQILESIEGAKWIDDDKGNVSISFDVEGPDGKRENLVKVKANHKTREFSGSFGDFFASGMETREGGDVQQAPSQSDDSPTAESGDARP